MFLQAADRQVYPDSKVILTVRDREKWYESALSTIYSYRRADQVSTPGMHQIVARVVSW